MKKTGLVFFALGIISGLLCNIAARKVKNAKILPDGWLEEGDFFLF